MIKSFYTLGKILSQDKNYADYFEPWANPFPKINNDDAKVIYASITNGILEGHLQEENFSNQRVIGYLYRKVEGPNGTNLVPTFLLFPDNNHQKYIENIRKLIKKLRQSVKKYKHTFITKLQIDEIERMLIKGQSLLNINKRYLFTIKIDKKYFGDFKEYQNLFYETAYGKYYNKSSSKDKVCAVTYEPSDNVWGRIDTLGFTVDAISFSRNGFDPADSYKMFPVSPAAVKILEGAKRIVIESNLNLTQNFYGLKYFILPHFIQDSDENIKEVIELFIDKSLPNSIEPQGSGIIGNENIINEIIKEESLSRSDIYYDIFFYQPNNAQFLIKLHLSDVLPSRFKQIFVVKDHIEKKYELLNRIFIKAKNRNSKDVIKRFKINFGGFYENGLPPMYGIKDYFSQKIKTDTIFHPYFFKILEAVFYGTSLNKDTILKSFMEKIVAAFKNIREKPNDFVRHVKTSFTIYQFFDELKLFNSNKMEDITNEPTGMAFNIESFIQQHNYFFDDIVKRGAFYLGILTNILLEKQNSHLKSKPFMNQLNGLNLDIDQMEKIHLKLMNKLYQYNDKLKKEEHKLIQFLNPLIGKSLINKTTLSRTELSYAFALGMVMQKEFFWHNLNTLNNN